MGAYSNLGDLSDKQEITEACWSSNFIDLGVDVPQIGVGQHAPFLCIQTNTAPTNAADAIAIEICCSATNNLTNLDGTIKVVYAVCGVNLAQITVSDARFAKAGAWILRCPLPYEIDLRYLQLYYDNSPSNGTITLDAWLNDGPPSDFGKQVLASNVSNP